MSRDWHDPYVKIGGFVAAVWLVVLLAVLARVTDGILQALVVLAGLLTALGTVLAPFSGKIEKMRLPTVERSTRVTVVSLLLVADLSCTAGWAIVAFHQATKPIDVLDELQPRELTGVLPGQAVLVELHSAREPERDAVVLTIDIADTETGQGICRPFTTLAVRQAGGTAAATTGASSGQPITVPLSGAEPGVLLEIVAHNRNDDRNCAVELRISGAHLDNI